MKVRNEHGLPTVDYREVKPLQGNLKDLSHKNHDKLLAVLQKRGFTTPLFLWRNPADEAMYLMDGHQRQRVMTANDLNDNGSYHVPYVLIPAETLKEAKEQLLEITSQYGTITQEGLDEFGFDLDLGGLDINFDALDLGYAADAKQKDKESEDDVPPLDVSAAPVSQAGEIFQLGPHRLMCGDATNGNAIAALAGGVSMDLVFTDPPYNVDYEGKTADALKIENDKFADAAAFLQFLTDSFTAMSAVSKAGAAIYICHADSEGQNFRAAMVAAGWQLKQCIVWVKNVMVMGRQDYQWKHEPILYGWKPGEGHYFVENRSKTTVWNELEEVDTVFDGEHTTIKFRGMEVRIKGEVEGQIRQTKDKDSVWAFNRPTRSTEHPTMKPVALVSEAVRNSSKRGENVLDSFGGSGSTLIACEKLGRVCFMSELDPKYCDVIRKRYWRLMTGSEEGWAAGTPVVGSAVAPV